EPPAAGRYGKAAGGARAIRAEHGASCLFKGNDSSARSSPAGRIVSQMDLDLKKNDAEHERLPPEKPVLPNPPNTRPARPTHPGFGAPEPPGGSAFRPAHAVRGCRHSEGHNLNRTESIRFLGCPGGPHPTGVPVAAVPGMILAGVVPAGRLGLDRLDFTASGRRPGPMASNGWHK